MPAQDTIHVASRWAQSLTDDRVAADLRRLARDIKFHSPDERAALLEEAAGRLLRRPRHAVPLWHAAAPRTASNGTTRGVAAIEDDGLVITCDHQGGHHTQGEAFDCSVALAAELNHKAEQRKAGR